MAPIAGLLIEYFVVGAVAGIWGIPFALAEFETHPDFPMESALSIVAILVPALYLLGMVCDLLGYRLTHPFKELIEAQVASQHGETKLSSQFIHAFAVVHEPALAKELDARSARDRIARGSLVAVLPLLVYWPYSFPSREMATVVSFLLIVVLAMLWHRMQKLSASYEMQARKNLRAKYGTEFAAAISRPPAAHA